jgi:hypothetical protein
MLGASTDCCCIAAAAWMCGLLGASTEFYDNAAAAAQCCSGRRDGRHLDRLLRRHCCYSGRRNAWRNEGQESCSNWRRQNATIDENDTEYNGLDYLQILCTEIDRSQARQGMVCPILLVSLNTLFNRGIQQPPKIDFKIDRKSTVFRY